jgi:SRSO17 transposase
MMAEELQEGNSQNLHHFITASKWGSFGVMDAITLGFADQIKQAGLQDDICLIIDECGNPKKGKHSAAVKRQYCGQTGKIDNCQVGIFGALCGGSLVNLVQAKLSGKDDGISKIALAKEIIEHVTKNLKVSVKWVCFDAFYGRDTKLLADLIKQGLPFIADVPDNLHLWLEPFQMRVPKNKAGGRGRKHSYPQPNKTSVSIKNYTDSLQATEWKYITVRQQSGGKKLKAWFHSKEVYMLNPITGKRQLITLLIRQDKDGTIKYSYCHCPGCNVKELAYRQSKRYFVEKAFREGKKELGLNQYQTRSEQSWNKHMAMVMLAQLFLNQEKIYHYVQSKLWLTTQDVIRSLKCVLRFVRKSIENFANDILLKQPPDKRLLYKLMHLRI